MSTLIAFTCLLAGNADGLPTVKDFALPDAAGKKHTAADWKGKRAVVLLLCPSGPPVIVVFGALELARATDAAPMASDPSVHTAITCARLRRPRHDLAPEGECCRDIA